MQNKGPQYHTDGRPIFRIVTSAGEAEEHLRVIRAAMERSTKHSTLSGLSGVLAGSYALAAALLVEMVVQPTMTAPLGRLWFVLVWGTALVLAMTTDILLTKRRAARIGKTAFSPLGKQLLRAVAPGLIAGMGVTLFYLLHPEAVGTYIYGLWMLCYATSLLAIGMLSVREVSVMGWAFLGAGMVTLCLPSDFFLGPRAFMAMTFGGFHVFYGIWMGVKHGW